MRCFMETLFIINPCAGQGKDIDKLVEKINTTGAKIYITKSVGDAEFFVREYCKNHTPVRFIACGGDGTLNEVLNGAFGKDNVEIGVLPIGTGNDFCRNFPKNFSDIESLIKGRTVKCDAIRYTTDGVIRYCANMFNIGFDCNVADMTATMKKKPFISGSLAYFISILANLIKKKGANLKIEIDDKLFYSGPLLLTALANGKFCGGGIMSNPLADISDGKININIIRNVSRLRFLTLLPLYIKGTHVKKQGLENIISNLDCKKVVLTPLSHDMRLCCDGEIQNAGKTEFEIVPSAFNFVIPNKL